MGWYKNHKSELIVGGGALVAGVLSFFITLSVYPSIKNNTIKQNENNEILKENQVAINNNETKDIEKILAQNDTIIYTEENTLKDENNSEIQNNTQEQNENSEDNINHDVLKNDNTENVKTDDEKQYVVEDRNDEQYVANNDKVVDEDTGKLVEAIAINNKSKELVLELPISGDVIKEFAKDKLVFSETLNEWITHDGVDILGEVASPVKASADGTVESIKMDPRYGNTIIINHGDEYKGDEYKTVYSNLSTLELVYVGKKVQQGEIISGIGDGFGFESKEGAHLHFEVIKNGENIDPLK